MVQSLGLRTVTEGVEYKEQINYLAKHGDDVIQGYYFSKPLNSEHNVHIKCKHYD
jgi:sensor c-di-GMP phosphodiesterase-like protein